MKTIFIGGSRRLTRLNAVIRGRLDNIVEGRHAILIGDANGGDRAVQAYLAERGYRSVTVYCTNGTCRNNVGGWPVRSVQATHERGFDFYALKDAAMAGDAECGFMLWDGKSKGTLLNIERLLGAGKPVVVYLAADQVCHTVRSQRDLSALVPPARLPGADTDFQGALFPIERAGRLHTGLLAASHPKRRGSAA